MNSIDAITLKYKMDGNEIIFLIDVRELWEHQEFNIGGQLIPLNSIFENLSLIPNDRPVIIYCQKGIRSQLAIQRLQQKHNYHNLVNLSGGMSAWKRQLNL
ncbi:MAG: rhodanese-like domain-containing protein [Ferruginibacter sp.]